MRIETYLSDLIEGRRQSAALLDVLRSLSYLYRLAIQMRHWAYDNDWLTSSSASIPVVSIGNITAGGTGKTPLVCLLAKEFMTFKKVAILTRGFRSLAEYAQTPLRINQSLGLVSSVEECGDEPLLLSKDLPYADIWVNKNRLLSAKEAHQKKAELIFLDDGLQHRKLKRNFEIVVIDGKDPFGKGFFLPRGWLRDPVGRLNHAHLIVVNHVEDEAHFQHVKNMLFSYSSAPVVGGRMAFKEECFMGKKVGVFCGLGRPQRFIEHLQKAGVQIVDSLLLPDHTGPSDELLTTFAEKCRQKRAECLVCTEKDLIKLNATHSYSLPIVSAKASLEILFGKENWQNALKAIHNL